MSNSCYSCGIPLTGEQTAKNYCTNCLDEKGDLRSRREVLAGISQWLSSWAPEGDAADFLKRAEHYLKAMPEWAEK